MALSASDRVFGIQQVLCELGRFHKGVIAIGNSSLFTLGQSGLLSHFSGWRLGRDYIRLRTIAALVSIEALYMAGTIPVSLEAQAANQRLRRLVWPDGQANGTEQSASQPPSPS